MLCKSDLSSCNLYPRFSYDNSTIYRKLNELTFCPGFLDHYIQIKGFPLRIFLNPRGRTPKLKLGLRLAGINPLGDYHAKSINFQAIYSAKRIASEIFIV